MSALFSQEHYELMAQFERQFKGERLDREDKSLWRQGHVYQDGRVNSLFLAFRQGAAYGTAIARTTPDHQEEEPSQPPSGLNQWGKPLTRCPDPDACNYHGCEGHCTPLESLPESGDQPFSEKTP